MLYLFSDSDSFTDTLLADACRIFPQERRDHILRFRRIEDQKRSAIGYLLLMYGLRTEYGIQMPPAFSFTKQGKPFFAEKNMPFFSISHSGDYVGCAIHTSEIGLDIQKTVPFRPALAKKICTREELASVNTSADLCEIWSKKESASKLLGTGITGEFRDLFLLHPDIHTHSQSLNGGEYFLSVSIFS